MSEEKKENKSLKIWERSVEMPPLAKIYRAFDIMYDQFPYFSSIVSGWKIARTTAIPTMATDGPNLYYNEEFVKGLNINEVRDVILHEAGHVFLGHHFRFDEDQFKKYGPVLNIALDLALNDTIMRHFDPAGQIRKMGLFPGELPNAEAYKGKNKKEVGELAALIKSLPKNKTAEFYFQQVKQLVDKLMKDCQECQGTGKHKECEGSGKKGGAQGEGEGKEKGQGHSHGDGEECDDCKGTGKCPNCHGTGKEGVVVGIGDVWPHPAPTQEELEQAKQEWEKQQERNLEEQKRCGHLPGWIETLGREIYSGKSIVDWRTILRRFLTRYTPGKFTFTRPNRRSSYRRDIVLPARHSIEKSKGCVLVDTSGSMSDAECNIALREMESILMAYKDFTIDMRMCDTRLINDESAKRTFTRYDFPMQMPQAWYGRGGTDLSPAVTEIGKSKEYAWLIIVSDMEWAYAQCPNPGVPTLWACTREPNYGQVPFGMVLKVDVS